MSFYFPNAKAGLCVAKTKAGAPCRNRRKYLCLTCDVHMAQEDEAARQQAEQPQEKKP